MDKLFEVIFEDADLLVLNKPAESLMCHFSRCIQKIEGALRYYPCPVIYDDARFEMGRTLEESLRRVYVARLCRVIAAGVFLLLRGIRNLQSSGELLSRTADSVGRDVQMVKERVRRSGVVSGLAVVQSLHTTAAAPASPAARARRASHARRRARE